MQASAIASLYTYETDAMMAQMYLSKEFQEGLQTIKSWHETFGFIQSFGTHFLVKATMGARFQENIYFNEEVTYSQL